VNTTTNGVAVTRSDWRTTEKGCESITLKCGDQSVRITQRKPGGMFSRIMCGEDNTQDWKSLSTNDRDEALSRAEAFLRALSSIESQAVGDAAPAAHEQYQIPPVTLPVTTSRESQNTGGPAPLALGKLCTDFKESPRFKRLGKKTQRDHSSTFQILLGHFGESRDVTSLDADDFEEFTAVRARGGIKYATRLRSRTGRDLGVRTRQTKPAGARSIEADLKLCRMMFIWAMRKKVNGKRMLEEDPMAGVEIKKEINPKRPVATHDRFERTLAETHLKAGAESDQWARQLWVILAVALIVLEGTGRRLSAVLGLKWSDLRLDEEGEFQNATITFRSYLDKKGRATELPLHSDVARVLAHYRATEDFAGRSDLVFPGRDGKDTANGDRLRQLLEEAEIAAGLEPLDGSKFHAYRRKFATERGNLPDHVVMELMGITDPKVFSDCYRKRSDVQLRDGLSNVIRVNDLRLERVA
jgi:integrase